MKAEILSLLQEIRDELDKDYKHISLASNKKNFNRCYSAIYLIEDIEESFEYYKSCNNDDFSLAAKYLMIYGIFEALYMQQCALSDLYIALNYPEIDYTKYHSDIDKIRIVRNDIAGHPTCRKGKYSTYLSRPDLSLSQIRYEETDEDKFIDFNIMENLQIQEVFVKTKLLELLNFLEKERQEHVNTFKDIELEDCFKMLVYANGKIYSKGAFYVQDDDLGFKLVKDMIDGFKAKLNERFENWEKLHFSYEIKQVEEIYNYLISNPQIINETEEDSTFLKINLLENMFNHLKNLRDIAKEIDQSYQHNLNDFWAEDNNTRPIDINKDFSGLNI